MSNIYRIDTGSNTEYSFSRNINIRSLVDLKLFNGDDLIFSNGKKNKVMSHEIKINTLKDGDLIFCDIKRLANKIITHKSEILHKVMKFVN
tara:strand:- start:548 stop:820 length:273 start_codon:yes stop_codon:yes gene_type:complete